MPADFRRLMVVRTLFTLAVQMQAVMLGWRMYDLTHDPLHLGLIGLAEAGPALSLAMIAGWVVDRTHPLKVYRSVVALSSVSAVIFLLAQWPSLGVAPTAQVAMLYAASFATGTARAFSQPSVYATVPQLIARHDLPRASAWMSSSMQAARVAGPALGGLAVGALGRVESAGIVCALLAGAALVFAQIGMFRPDRPATAPGKFIDDLLEGARFVFRHPILLPALSLDMLSVLFGGVTALLPIYASDILHTGAMGLGILRAAPAVGAVLMSIRLTRTSLGPAAGKLLLASVVGFGVCILVFGLSTNLYLSVTALAISGMFDSVSVVIRSSAVQLASPEALRGRISAVNAMFIGSSNELGEFESGLAAKLFGTVPAVVFGGILCLSTVAAVALLSPRLRRLNLLADPAELQRV